MTSFHLTVDFLGPRRDQPVSDVLLSAIDIEGMFFGLFEFGGELGGVIESELDSVVGLDGVYFEAEVGLGFLESLHGFQVPD